jgi:hypothetical protein
LELIVLYEELKKKTEEENSYLKANDEVDSTRVERLAIGKRIVRDKIEKYEKLHEKAELTIQQREYLKNLIKIITGIEKANILLYKKKLSETEKKMQNVDQEVKLKTSYAMPVQNEPKFLDKKS